MSSAFPSSLKIHPNHREEENDFHFDLSTTDYEDVCIEDFNPAPPSSLQSTINGCRDDVRILVPPVVYDNIIQKTSWVTKGFLFLLVVLVTIVLVWHAHEIHHLKQQQYNFFVQKYNPDKDDNTAVPPMVQPEIISPGDSSYSVVLVPPQQDDYTGNRGVVSYEFTHLETADSQFPGPGMSLGLSPHHVHALESASVCCKYSRDVSKCSSQILLVASASRSFVSCSGIKLSGTCRLTLHFFSSSSTTHTSA